MKHKIKEVLESRGLSQKQLAEAIGMSETGMSLAINGSTTRATIEKIAQFLNIPSSELIDDCPTLKAKYGSDKTPLKLGAIEIPCYVLDNGMRVLSGRGIQRAIGSTSQSGAWLARFVNNGALAELFSAGDNSISSRINNPLKFLRNDAGGSQSSTNGYEATLLIDMCSVIIDANRAGVFNDENIVRSADIIIRAVAKTGIIALIDEVTGYDKAKERGKNELQKFLSEFLNEEASRWVKTFPDSFFEMLYRMQGWSWSNANAKPGYVGRLIDDWVYQRIGPAIRDELRKRNPANEKGHRIFKHHQFLAEIGKDTLSRHLEGLRALAIASGYNKSRFIDMLNRVYPRPNEQYTFDFDDI